LRAILVLSAAGVDDLDVLALAAILAGLPMGWMLAAASVRLAGNQGVVAGLRRTAALSLAAAGLAGWSVAVREPPFGLLGVLLAWQLLLLAVLDAEHLWLPRMLTLPLIGTGLAIAAPLGATELAHRALGAAAGFLVLRLLGLAYRRTRGREGLGGGDAWLLAGGGAWAGWMGLPTILVWSAGAGLAYAAVRALQGRPIAADQPIPFGVFLTLGIWLTWLYGPLGRMT
jgi:leader peptidase (prepilin peptidase)/N-methyltransferase